MKKNGLARSALIVTAFCLCMPLQQAFAEDSSDILVGSNGGYFKLSNGVSVIILPGTFFRQVMLRVTLKDPPDFSTVTPVTSAIELDYVTGGGSSSTPAKPIRIRMKVAWTPSQGESVHVYYLRPGDEYDDESNWIPKRPLSADEWYTCDSALQFDDFWVVGYQPTVGWLSAGPSVEVETRTEGTFFIAGPSTEL